MKKAIAALMVGVIVCGFTLTAVALPANKAMMKKSGVSGTPAPTTTVKPTVKPKPTMKPKPTKKPAETKEQLAKIKSLLSEIKETRDQNQAQRTMFQSIYNEIKAKIVALKNAGNLTTTQIAILKDALTKLKTIRAGIAFTKGQVSDAMAVFRKERGQKDAAACIASLEAIKATLLDRQMKLVDAIYKATDVKNSLSF